MVIEINDLNNVISVIYYKVFCLIVYIMRLYFCLLKYILFVMENKE